MDVDVAPDDIVEAGDRLAVVEAMKMEIAIPAPVSGRVRDVFVARNVQVDAGTPLFRIEPTSDRGADREVTDRIDLAALQTGHEAAGGIALVRASMLGFDVEPVVARRWLGSLDASDVQRAGGARRLLRPVARCPRSVAMWTRMPTPGPHGST